MTEEKKSKQPKPGAGKKSPKKAPDSVDNGSQADVTTPAAAKNVNPIVLDDTYHGLREENRVVMRRTIAVNLDNFRAAPENFDPRPHATIRRCRRWTRPSSRWSSPPTTGCAIWQAVLGALARQTFGDSEVIVVDDASVDGDGQWVAEQLSWVRLIVNRRNLGFAASCNTGAAAARGRYVVLLNNDTEPEPTWLAELAQAIAAHPAGRGIVASKLLLWDRRDTLHTTGDMLGADGIPHNRGVWEQDRGQYDAAGEIFSGCGGASAYRKDRVAGAGRL